jgi:hypothetical protein
MIAIVHQSSAERHSRGAGLPCPAPLRLGSAWERVA